MSNIDISARHTMNLEGAQAAADDLAQDLAEKFDVDYGWDGDFIHFERPGVDGSIEVSERVIHIQARLGLLLMFLQARIEEEICRYLKSHFGCVIED
jgi:putative polyhydroxyalkanoate system protein